MAMKRSLGAPDVLHKLGRPGFPKGMVVLLVGCAEKERREIEEQMHKLCYHVTSCGSCSQARQELTSRGIACFDIILAEAGLVAKDNREGQLFLETANNLPLVLISSPGTTTECVWRGIEVGAADVLEKPLSLLKLQNVWQHVVRKVMDQEQKWGSRTKLASKEEEIQTHMDHSPSRCTLSSSVSAGTISRFPTDDKSVADHEASYCGSQDGKEGSMDVSMSNNSTENSHTADSPSGVSDTTQVYAEAKPAKKARRSKDSSPSNPSCKPPLAIRPYPSQTLPTAAQSGSPTVVGMVHPSWASSAPGSQAFRGSVPPGCVWGTPLHPPPGWQGMFPNGSGPLLGSAANCNMARCHSAPVQKVDVLSSMNNFDALADLDPALLVDFTDDLLLGDDFLDCGDNFLDGLGSSLALPPPADGTLEKPPIGLRLRKSESLVDLINQRLNQCASEQKPLPTFS